MSKSTLLALTAMSLSPPAFAQSTSGSTPAITSLTAQDMLNLASQDLQQIAEWPLSIPPAGLAIALTHTCAFHQNQQGLTYGVNIGNAAGSAATSSLVTVTETVPSSLTLVSMSGTGWGCSANQCFRNDTISAVSSYQAITVTVNVASNAPSMVTNQVSVWGGGSPGATANDPTSIAAFTCDIDGNGVTNVVDVEIVIDEALGLARAVNDLNHDGVVNVADVQKALNAALGRGCPY